MATGRTRVQLHQIPPIQKNPVAAVEAKALANARAAFPPFPEAARAQAPMLEEVQLAVFGRKPVKEAVAAIIQRVKPLMPA